MKTQYGNCAGCRIPLSDGYTLECKQCCERRGGRLRRGELRTPSGYAGEAIDNSDPKGRLVAA